MAVISNNPTAEGTNSWTTPSDGRTSNNLYATAAPAKNGSVAGIWKTFGIADPGSATITKVEIGTEHKVSTVSSIATLGRQISWDNGVSWSTNTYLTEAETEVLADTIYWLDVTAATAWTWAKLDNANLQVRVTAKRGNSVTAVTFSLDAIWVRVTYTAVVNQTALDSAAASDATLRGKTFAEADAGGSSEATRCNKAIRSSDTATGGDADFTGKAFPVSEGAGGADAVLRGRTTATADYLSADDDVLRDRLFSVAEAVVSAETVIRGRTIALEEAAIASDGVSVVLRVKTCIDAMTAVDAVTAQSQTVLKMVADVLSALEAARVDKRIIEAEAAGGVDALRRGKSLVIADAIASLDRVARNMTAIVADAAASIDAIMADKSFITGDDSHAFDLAVSLDKMASVLDELEAIMDVVVRDRRLIRLEASIEFKEILDGEYRGEQVLAGEF